MLAPRLGSLLTAVCLAVLGVPLSGFISPNKTRAATDLPSIEQRLQAVYDQVVPAIVRFAYVKDDKFQFGSGVIVTAEGHVAISGPVQAVVQDDLLDLRLVNGRRVRGKALGWSSEFGFGMLKITEPGPWPHIDLGPRADMEAGQLCVAVGYPPAS